MKKILIVDDNPVVLKTLSMKLTSEGFEVITATEGGDAVGTVRRERPDLILLDIGFPPDVAHGGGVPWDGYLIMNWLRRMDESSQIPIIVISGAEPEEHKDRMLAAGAVGYFQKPIDNDALVQAIRETLGELQPEQPAVEP
jgi:CheY-like chemotaxis protein